MELQKILDQRWSARDYSADSSVSMQELEQVFAAAARAQSAFNEQPWRYLITTPQSAKRADLEACLVDGNDFAKSAWVLGIAFGKKNFTHNDKPNTAFAHDVGAANMLIALKAKDLGLDTRFMGGFFAEKANALAPAGFEALAMFVIGHATVEAKANPQLRERKAPCEFVYLDTWENAFHAQGK